MAIEVGAKTKGKISGITKFGAFVDLEGGKTGLVHISEVSSQYVNDINEILSVGDDVDVKVMSIGDDGKIALSIRRCQEEKPTRQRKHQHKKAPRQQKTEDFDTMLNNFMKDSDERLSSLRRNTEGKRGGRGGRRS